ncbi:hypothetical protein PFISCL1PPCAC_5205 [Pristionchus fissidentatus]|uniref:Uncharacterized protein n=1 Tax=Pristionchus fissidentatus TaxID=1538716 RepID=A0AAV5V465_9BILA|nr:hypothetical protein PFISCL1PPCAC_5205 [Pristionchus fissidentatus]
MLFYFIYNAVFTTFAFTIFYFMDNSLPMSSEERRKSEECESLKSLDNNNDIISSSFDHSLTAST